MKDGRSYVAESAVETQNVVGNKSFNLAVIGLVHGHVYGIIKGLCNAGACVYCLWDYSEQRKSSFLESYPECKLLSDPEEAINDAKVDLVINCLRPSVRADFSYNCLIRGKSVFSDKPGFLTLEQGERIKSAILKTNARFCIYFSEHFHHEGVILAQRLIEEGKVGRVFNYIGMGPHRLNAPNRPDWFFNPDTNGDVILDLGCHLIEQFLTFSGNADAKILSCQESNINNPDHPEFFDNGTFTIVGENGATGLIKVDWFTPDDLDSWGDCRAFVYGTEGEIEIRKYCNLAQGDESDVVLYVNNSETKKIVAKNTVGFDFFGKFILDCMNFPAPSKLKQGSTDLSIFCVKAMELSVKASNAGRLGKNR